MSAVKFFPVGGAIRDELLGVQPDDWDFSVEGCADVDAMAAAIVERGGRFNKDLDKLNAGTRKHFTLKAQWQNKGACDFVMCRVEGPHSDGRRPDWVRPGTLFDDLLRRDFTFNAMARTEDGQLVDPFGGQADLANRVVRCVGDSGDADQDAVNKLLADSVRTFRALRFSVKLQAELHSSVRNAFDHPDLPALVASLNDDQKRKELGKLFACNSLAAVRLLNTLPTALQEAVFASGQLWLKPTTEKAA